MPSEMFPPGAPTISGSVVSVEFFLNNPPVVYKTIELLATQRFIAPYIFNDGPIATGGAVLYSQITATELFTERDVQAVAPGAEFPLVSSGESYPQVATVQKWAGAYEVTDEERRRDRRDVIARGNIKLANTVARKIDQRAIAELLAAPTRTAASPAAWSNPATDIIGTLESARTTVDDADFGYTLDTWLINPAQRLGLKTNTAIRAALPRENTQLNPVVAGDLQGLLGFTYYVSNRVPAGTAIGLMSKMAGSMSDEKPFSVEVVPQRERQTTRVQADRVSVPYVTDPKAVIVVTGC